MGSEPLGNIKHGAGLVVMPHRGSGAGAGLGSAGNGFLGAAGCGFVRKTAFEEAGEGAGAVGSVNPEARCDGIVVDLDLQELYIGGGKGTGSL